MDELRLSVVTGPPSNPNSRTLNGEAGGRVENRLAVTMKDGKIHKNVLSL